MPETFLCLDRRAAQAVAGVGEARGVCLARPPPLLRPLSTLLKSAHRQALRHLAICPPRPGSLEHVIDLHQRGQLTHRGKPAVLEYLEREDAARRRDVAAGGGAAGSAAVGGPAGEDGGWANWSRRLTADVWAGGVRCRDVIYNYK